MEEEINLLSENLERIRDAANDMRVSLDIPNASIETVANVVSTLVPLPPVEENDVCFYDYDGTRVASFTASEFLEIEEMPIPPTHAGLIFQGWNWILNEAKQHVTEYKKLDIGAHYITDDNKTRIYINIPQNRTDPCFTIGLNGTIIINWGDGTIENITGNNEWTEYKFQHNYNKSGSYIITLEIDDDVQWHLIPYFLRKNGQLNSMQLESAPYWDSIQKIEIGKNCSLGGYADIFQGNHSIQSITMPLDVEYGRPFNGGPTSLKYITIPKGRSMFDPADLSGLTSLEHISLPAECRYLGNSVLAGCTNLKRITLPYNVSNINKYAISSCYNLTYIIIPKQVSFNQGENYKMSSNYGLKYYDFSHFTSVPAAVDVPLGPLYSVDCKLVVPDNLYEQWKTATYWVRYKDSFIKASEWNGGNNSWIQIF